jgi:hypothetical protein
MRTSDSFIHLAKALLHVQGKVSSVTRDARADAGRRTYKYATLEAVIDTIRPACLEAGLVLLQSPELDSASGTVSVETRLIHAESGEWVSVVSACAAATGDAQAVGSAQTYMRRYGLMSLLGLAPEDDDGQAARGAPTGQSQPPQVQQVSRDKIVQRLVDMHKELGSTPPSFDGMTDQQLMAHGAQLRTKLDNRK